MINYLKMKLKGSAFFTHLKRIENKQNEILKGLIFNSTICDSKWLKYKSFSPGEWAADFGLLYTIYRVLNDMKPQSIIEFGLGQSSKMLHQYAAYYNKNAVTIEHDEKWVHFFNEGKDGNYSVAVHLSELENVNYKDFVTLTYKEIDNTLEGKQFDFILVDGPFSSKHYSRSEVIGIAKSNLKDNFCIIMDDTERIGEQETIQEVYDVLKSKSIDFCSRTYTSTKSHTLICSANLKFLTSL